MTKYYRFIKYKPSEYSIIRIIPHSSVLNSQARRFMTSMYELFSVRESLIKREGFSIAIRPAPDFWWITRMSADGDAKKAEYYVAMPKEFVDAFRTKFRNHEQWKRSTLEVVDEAFDLPTEDAELYALKYKRHNMFSLSYDYGKQTTPVRDVLSVSDELADGESIDIFIRAEPIKRGKWKKLVDYAWETWDKGGMPYPVGFDPLRFLRDIAYGIFEIIVLIKDLINDIRIAIQRQFFHKSISDDEPKKKERPNLPNPDRAELLVNGDLSKETRNKRNLPAFKTDIRYVVRSADVVKRGMLARSVANAYSESHGDNRLESVRVNIRAKQALNDLANFRIVDPTSNVMSTDELGKLAQLPTADVQAEFADALTTNQRVEITLPAAFADESGILAGTTTDRGAVHGVHIPTSNPDRLFYGRAYVGMQGMGKDQAIINLIVEAKRKHNIGAVIPDVINEQNGHRGMADAIRDHLPPDEVIDIDLADTEHPVYFGLQSVIQNVKEYRIAADRIAEEITQFLLAEGDDDKFQTADYLREAAKATMGDMQAIKYMFTSKSFRSEKIAELSDTFDMDVWEDFDRMNDPKAEMSGRQGMIYGPIHRRLGQIINSEFLKPMFCQTPNPDMDLYRWIDEGKVVIFRFPKEDVISRRVIEILMYWIVLNVFLIKVAQDGNTKALGTFLVLNEPHQYLSPGLIAFMKRMLTEGRKKRLAPIFAFHNFQQFREYPGFVNILKTGINWHLFSNNDESVYKELAPILSKTFESHEQAMRATRQYQYIASWINTQGEAESPFIVDALPLVGNRYPSQDNSFLTKRHARQFGRPIGEVLAEIKRRNKAAMSRKVEG